MEFRIKSSLTCFPFPRYDGDASVVPIGNDLAWLTRVLLNSVTATLKHNGLFLVSIFIFHVRKSLNIYFY